MVADVGGALGSAAATELAAPAVSYLRARGRTRELSTASVAFTRVPRRSYSISRTYFTLAGVPFCAPWCRAMVVRMKPASSRLGNSGLKCAPRDSLRLRAPCAITRASTIMFCRCLTNCAPWFILPVAPSVTPTRLLRSSISSTLASTLSSVGSCRSMVQSTSIVWASSSCRA